MAIASDYYEEAQTWGKVSLFHSVTIGNRSFLLYEPLTIVTIHKQSFIGQITAITHTSLDFMTQGRHYKIIQLDDIKDIHY